MRLVATALALALAGSACTSNGAVSTTTTSPAPSSILEPVATDRLLVELDLEELGPVAASLRQLEFRRPIRVEIVEAGDFQTRVGELGTGEHEDGAWLRLLGVLPDQTTVAEATSRLLASSVAILDDDRDRILVRADAGLSPYVDSVVVHEMVHALQRQHFPSVAMPSLRAGDGAYVARALLEGDAQRITQRFLGSLSASEEGRYEEGRLGVAEDTTAIRGSTPPYVLDLVTIPGADGLLFLQGLDNADVDELLAVIDTPDAISSEQLIVPGGDPTPLPAALGPVSVPGYEPVGEPATLGPGSLRLILHRIVDDDLLAAAIVGWGGDAFEVRASGDDVIFAYLYRGERAEDAQELAAAFRVLFDTRLPEGAYASVRVDGDSTLVLAASDPTVSARLDELFGEFGEEVFLVQLG